MNGSIGQTTFKLKLCAGGGGGGGGWERSTRVQLKALNEMCFGSLEGMPGGKMRHSFPKEHEARVADPVHYRYPGAGGDSYMDLVTALVLRLCLAIALAIALALASPSAAR